MHLRPLTLADLKSEARRFASALTARSIPELYGVTDGKAVGTFVEQNFREHLQGRFAFAVGNAANGIDLPDLDVDLKVTSIRQPQSSCPFRSASQKVFGLGYHLLVFAYNKIDDPPSRSAKLDIQHAIFVDRECTADYQTTSGVLGILSRGGNEDDVVAFLEERNLPLDEIGRRDLAQRILSTPPRAGYLTVSNALQWRLQYGRVLALAGSGQTPGVEDLLA